MFFKGRFGLFNKWQSLLIHNIFIGNKKIKKECVFNEINILRILNHPNLIKLYEVYETSSSYYLVFDICYGGSLLQKIKTYGKLTEKQIIPILKGILKGLNYMHSQSIMHRDLKIENIIFKDILNDESAENVRIIDFGLSLNFQATTKNKSGKFLVKCGTPGYISPEIFSSKTSLSYNQKCDIFSLGVVFHMMYLIISFEKNKNIYNFRLFGFSPFKGSNVNEVLEKNMRCFIDYSSSIYKNISSTCEHNYL